MTKWISYLLLFCFALACQKPEPVTKRKPPEQLEILWRAPLVPDPSSQYTLSNDPFLFDSVVAVNITYTKNGDIAPVLFFDAETGELKKQWSNYIDEPELYVNESIAQEGDHLLLNTGSSIDCINMITGMSQWSRLISGNRPYIYTHNGYVYNVREYNDRSADIIRSPVGAKNYQLVYSFTQNNGWNIAFDSMGFGELSNGDKLLFWKNRGWKYGSSKYPTEIFAYNLTADSLLWRNPGFDHNGTVVPLQADAENVFGLVRNHAFCLDLQTGQTKWIKNVNKLVQPEYSMELFNADFHLEEDFMIIGGQSDELFAINKKDGSLRYVNRTVPDSQWGGFTYFEGKLFFSSGELQIVDVRNGERLIFSPFNSEVDDIESKIVIDPDRRVMYFHNYRELFCAKIPDDKL